MSSYRLVSGMRVLVGACDGRGSVALKTDFPPGEEALHAAFASIDADGNGRLDAVEIQQALSVLGMAAMPSEAFAVLQKYDTDRSGGIELAEFARLVHELPCLFQTSDGVDSGEVVAILDETPKFDHILVARQDGVRGYIRVRNLHVQAWPFGQWQPSLSTSLTSHTSFVWSSSELQQRGSFRIDGHHLTFTHGSSRHEVTVLSSHAFSVEGWDGYLFLLDAARTEVVLWDGAAVIDRARAEGVAAAAGAAPALAPGWQGVFTWAKHERTERMGCQFSVSDAGRTFTRRGSEAPDPIVLITPHAWHHGDGTRVYLLDDSSDGRSMQRAITVWTPSVVAACIAFPTTYARKHGAPADAWRLAPGGSVIAGNVMHAGGGTLLRRRPDLSLDAANRTDVQIFDGDICTVLDVADAPAVPPPAAAAAAVGEGLSTCAWVRVCKAGVGEGWLSTNNVHIQGHGYAPAAGAPAPPVPGINPLGRPLLDINPLGRPLLDINPLGRPLPPEWQQPQTLNLHLAAVEQGSADWARLESRLRETVPSATLRRVERIQNVRLYASFDVQMAMLQNDLGGERPMVQELFHGTGKTPPHTIYNGQEGFDMRFCDQGLWGIASYFAVEAAYSNTDKYCYKNERGERELLVADVITGRTIELPPDASLRIPPEMLSTTASKFNQGAPWDFFMSHKQDESGHPVALITMDLTIAGKKVWLDVNMNDCGAPAMMEGVEHSKTFVLVLSDRYFDSKYCVMELRRAISLRKKIVLCHKQGVNVGAILQRRPPDPEFANIGDTQSLELIISDAQFRKCVVERLIASGASMPSGTRYDSVTGMGGGGGHSRVYMIYRHDRAYPKFRLTYVTDQDRRPSMHEPPTPAKPPTLATPRFPIPMPLPFSSAAAVDTFALYLRPHLALGSARWAVGWQAADHLQQNWGGLHVTLCSFAPKLSSGAHGHHGGGLTETLRQVQARLFHARGPGGGLARWQLAARHGPIWYRRDHVLMIQLQTAAPSENLSAICHVVQSAGMVNPRSAANLHLTLGDTRRLPPLPGGATFPAEGANEPLPPELAADLYEAHWALSVAKLPGGSCPATDNEVLPI